MSNSNNLRFYISDEDLDWLQGYKEDHNFKNNGQLFQHFKKLAQHEVENQKKLNDLSDLREQQDFIKDKVKENNLLLKANDKDLNVELHKINLKELQVISQKLNHLIEEAAAMIE
ncbi:MAG: hypothetical protein N4R16_04960 [Lactobacillus crispatus]|nr:hypothetical protein [Lactobacillus crispatus]